MQGRHKLGWLHFFGVICFMSSINEFERIFAVVAPSFAAVDGVIRQRLEAQLPLINDVVDYIVGGGGNRLRPLVCLLAARACGYEGELHVEVAATVEILHTATLLHDDVVDASGLRRGRATANARWGNPAAVLIGDYLISRAFQMIVALGHRDVLEVMASSTCIISEGEVLQLVTQRDPHTTEERYMQVIHGKTAKMFEAAAEGGCVLGEHRYRQAMVLYARHLGAAFQIIDDVLDYTSSSGELGKNVGDDLAEGKPTLPLIQAMKVASPQDAELIREAIRHGGLDHLSRIIDIVRACGAVDYAHQVAARESQLAVAALATVPASPYRQAMIDLAEMALRRAH